MAPSSSTVLPHFMLSGWATNDLGVSKKKGTCGGIICLQRNSFEPWKLRVHSARVPTNRGHRLIVAANPTEAAIIPNKPLITKEDLVAYFASGCKPKTEWRIGTEHEKFGFELGSLRPMRYGQIAELLNGIAERFGWDKIMEGDNVIGLKQGKQKVTLEPGGQLELSGAPLETLHQTCAEINSHLCQVKAVAGTMGIGFLAIGFQPKWEDKDTPLLPMARFGIARKFFSKRGSLALDVMHRTCTVQVNEFSSCGDKVQKLANFRNLKRHSLIDSVVNLDYSSEVDMVTKFRASLALQPVATALFANSPFTKEKPNGFLSMRSHTWTDIDERRTGMIPFVFNDSFGFERYIDYALDVPMVCVYRQKKYIDCAGMSFRDFMAGKLLSLPGEFPTLNDWENHLTTIYPEVRLKRYLEMRGADAGPLTMLCALPAFWVGLLYDEVSLQNVLEMISDWTSEERQMLRVEVPKTGLNTPFQGGLLKDVAESVIKWAKDGLERRSLEESVYLNVLAEVVATGVTPAEKLLQMYNEKWGHNVDHVIEELRY